MKVRGGGRREREGREGQLGQVKGRGVGGERGRENGGGQRQASQEVARVGGGRQPFRHISAMGAMGTRTLPRFLVSNEAFCQWFYA